MTPIIEILPGDLVRSFDFESRDLDGSRACYIEGIVEGIEEDGGNGYPAYRIRVSRRVIGGKETPFEGRVYPPVNGTERLFGGVTDFVTLIIRPQFDRK